MGSFSNAGKVQYTQSNVQKLKTKQLCRWRFQYFFLLIAQSHLHVYRPVAHTCVKTISETEAGGWGAAGLTFLAPLPLAAAGLPRVVLEPSGSQSARGRGAEGNWGVYSFLLCSRHHGVYRPLEKGRGSYDTS